MQNITSGKTSSVQTEREPVFVPKIYIATLDRFARILLEGLPSVTTIRTDSAEECVEYQLS
jgi:hypothetical protein